MTCCDYLVEHNYQQICVGASEDGDVHGNPDIVWFVQPHSEIPFPADKQQNEHSDVHQSHTR